MLKISQAGKANHSVTLKLEGRVVGPWVGELRQVCETHLSEGRALNLDLADVTFADGLQNARRHSEKLLAVCGRTIEVNSEWLMWRSVCGQAFAAQQNDNFLKTHFNVLRIQQTNKKTKKEIQK